MAHFAEIDADGAVKRVIVAEQAFIDSGAVGDPGTWVQCSYNTRGGQHPQKRPLRKNYPGPGWKYDRTRDAFVPPKPHASWSLDEATCHWRAPKPMPLDGKFYQWDEALQAWADVTAAG